MPEIIATWAAEAAPPPLLTVSDWADHYRYLPATSAARGGRWRTDDVPYMRGVMDAVHEPGTRKIAVKKAAQIAGSETVHNIVGYFIAHDPWPMLFVHPTVEVAEEWSKDRLADMIRTTPALAAAVHPESTLTYKQFPNGFLAVGGANTPNTYARRAVRVAIGDDVDRFPHVVGDEGDPAELLFNRTTTFDDPLALLVSTPTLEGGRICSLYERSDQRRYFLTCPNCGRADFVTWNHADHWRVAFDDQDPESARLECPQPEYGGCGRRFTDQERRRMIRTGEWRATATPKEPGLVGFHIPAMLSTFPAVTLSYLVADWLAKVSAGREAMRVFINTKLAEGWEDRGTTASPHALMARRESYGDEGVEVPEWAAALTAGVDVQEDRFEIQVQAWGFGEERAVVNWFSVDGDPRLPETRARLVEALDRKYEHATGALLPVHATCIDSGFLADEVYDIVLAQQSVRRIYATKGVAGRAGEPIVSKPSERKRGKRGQSRPVRLYFVNTDDGKTNVMSALEQQVPGPGYYHVPLDLDTMNEEYFAQLCSEHRETRKNRHGVVTHTVWVKDRERNEALDTAVLCLAAFRLLNPNIRQMLDALRVRAAANTPSPAGPRPPKRKRFSSMQVGG